MKLNKVRISPTDIDRSAFTVQEFTGLKIDRSSQVAVLRIPTDAAGGVEEGASVRLITRGGDVYEGFIEVVADASDSRVIWCGMCFQPIGASR